MKNIKELREDIDLIDRELVKLFEKRMEVVEEVAKYKSSNKLPLKDEKREESLITKNVSLLKNHKYDRLLKIFFKDLMEYSRTLQSELMDKEIINLEKDFNNCKVAYQGIEGSFSSIALKKYFGDKIECKNVLLFEDAFISLQNSEVDYIILPIENSSTGSINEVYDLLKKYSVSIVGETYIPIIHNLIGTDGTTINTIKEVYSHEQGFKQSNSFLKSYDWKEYTYYNTAKSVKFIKESNRIDFAAIGSLEAAKYYGLNIIKDSIQNTENNTTRFVIISTKKIITKDANKISFITRTSHEPKSLYKILKKIADSNVNMLKIESRPVLDKPWEYIFYIDIKGSLNNTLIKTLLKEIEEEALYMLVLGNYYSERQK